MHAVTHQKDDQDPSTSPVCTPTTVTGLGSALSGVRLWDTPEMTTGLLQALGANTSAAVKLDGAFSASQYFQVGGWGR